MKQPFFFKFWMWCEVELFGVIFITSLYIYQREGHKERSHFQNWP